MKYNWYRRWILQGTREDQTTNLSALAQRWFSTSHQTATNSFSLEELSNVPIVILLGEPGIGKSSEIASYFHRASTEKSQDIWKFQEYPPNNFKEFFNQPQFAAWQTGQTRLTVFIDAFDEGLRPPVSLGRELVAALSSFAERLGSFHLRIACRTADWSEETSIKLRDLFGENSLLTVELDALGQTEIVSAAQQQGIDPYQFLEQIEQQALATLTLKPITLFDLLKQYQAGNGTLPKNRNALYHSMCRRLCEEHNQYRDEKDRQNNFTTDELFAEAARLATIMLTTRQLTVWTLSSTRELPDGALAIGQLHHGLSAEERLTRATLHTGFFASKGANRLGWAHLSYAEYLAAFYMNGKMTLPQIKSLIVHPDGNKIVPQLREVTAWLTTMNPSLLQFVADLDPETLFQSDLIVEDTEAREKLTAMFLELYHREILIEIPFNSHIRYRRLIHPNLSGQLTDFAHDSSRNNTSRYVAISIIHACELIDAANELIDLALNSNLEYRLRNHATYVVARIGSSSARLALKPLIWGGVQDIDDELKGAGLIATWPEHLTTTELFEVLTPRKRENLAGTYSAFLRPEIIDDISVTDLPLALQWATRFVRQYTDAHHHIDLTMQEIIDKIVYKSWMNFDTPLVCETLSQLILAKIAQYHPLFGTDRRKLEDHHQSIVDDLLRDESKRRRLLIEIINLVMNPDFSYHVLNYSIPLLLDTDLSWLLSLLETADSPVPRDTLLKLIEVVFRRWNTDHMTEMVLAIEHSEPLRETFGKWFFVELDSEYAIELQQAYKREQEHQAKYQDIENRRQEQRINPPPLIRLEEVLDQCEQGEIKEWWQTNRWLATNEYGNFTDWYGDVRQMPNWEQIDQVTKERILSSGIEFVINTSPETEKWLGQYSFWRPAISAYRMLFLLFDVGAEIPTEVLQKWAPAIVTFPHYFAQSERGRHNEFLKTVYENDNHGFRAWLERFLEHWHKPNLDIGIAENYLSRFDAFFDDDIARILLDYLDNPQIKPKHYTAILNCLLHKHLPEACSRAASDFRKLYDRHHILLQQIPLLCSLRADDTVSKLHLARLVQAKFKETANSRIDSARLAANLIASPAHGDWWYSIWDIIRSDVDFGREIIEATSGIYDDRRVAKIGSQLSEEETANLYLWIVNQYPHEEDPELDGWVSPRHTVTDWRNSLLNQLAECGTPEALTQIERIAQTYPDLYQLKRLRKYLTEHLYKNSWHPPQISDLLTLVSSEEKRFVQTDSQLLDLVIESLERLQKRLQGETPSAVDLWSIVSSEKICRPMDENALSNYVKRHLEQDLKARGIIVNREVEIRQKEGGKDAATGEIPDLYVSAISQSSHDNEIKQLVVLIETKGNWHDELKTAIQTQLVDRYLHNNDRATCGLYLVGWFNCQQWDQKDYRRNLAFRNELNNLSDVLNNRAVSLSNSLLDVRVFILDAALRDDMSQ